MNNKVLLIYTGGTIGMNRNPLTYVVSIALTFGVSLIVGWMISRKNRKINMVEALKGVD